jgi:hypothetical protein
MKYFENARRFVSFLASKHLVALLHITLIAKSRNGRKAQYGNEATAEIVDLTASHPLRVTRTVCMKRMQNEPRKLFRQISAA